MSLDIELIEDTSDELVYEAGYRILLRDKGSMREISRAEWDRRFPGVEPVFAVPPEPISPSKAVYKDNITHNVNVIAIEAGIYDAVWRPDENGIARASEMIAPLTAGLDRLRADPARFELKNPSNGYGSFTSLVAFLERYLEACIAHPDARVDASR